MRLNGFPSDFFSGVGEQGLRAPNWATTFSRLIFVVPESRFGEAKVNFLLSVSVSAAFNFFNRSEVMLSTVREVSTPMPDDDEDDNVVDAIVVREESEHDVALEGLCLI